jgi:hypothetical protein
VGNISYPGQPINLADGCSTGNAIHEIGHAIGLWHEHTRNDRDTYITVLTANISSGAAYNFQKTGSSGQDLGAYDYGSIMHYSAYSFSANGSATIVTIPPGIPIGQRTALSAGDINGVLALYPASTPPPPPAPVSVTIASNPSGMVVTVDGTTATTPATYSWTPGTTHTVAAASQSKSGTTYNFSSWSDGGAASHTITTPSAAATYTVSFAAQPPPPPAPVTITFASSPSGMSLTVDGVAVRAPASYSWTPGTTHTIAAANQGLGGTNYNFGSWSDGGAASHTITVPSAATTYTASFAAQAQQPVTITIASNPSGLSVTVDGSSVVAPATFSWVPGTTHTLGAANQTSGGKSYLFNAWSNGGAASQTITTPTAAATYTASFNQQLPTTVTVSSNPAGLTVNVDGSNVATPASFSWLPGTTHSLVASNQDSSGSRYLFTSWSCGSTSAQTITTPAAATTYTANFAQQQPASVTFASVPSGLSVSVDGAAVTTPATFSWFPGTAHSIAAANQSSGGSTYNFTSWSDSGAAAHTITTPASAAVYTATFTLQPVPYTVTTNPAGLIVTVDGAAVTAPATFSWLPGSSHTLAAANQNGSSTKYIFSSWSNGGAATQTISAPASPATYSANFSRQYLLSAVAAPANGGSIAASVPSSGGYYPANTSLSLTATPVSGYCFVNWSGSAASSSPVLQLNMAQPLSVTANFAAGSVGLSPGLLTIQAAGGVFNVTVTASCPWTLSAPPSWARYSKSSGTTSATVALTVDPNPSAAARSFYLAAGTRRVLVYQYGKK